MKTKNIVRRIVAVSLAFLMLLPLLTWIEQPVSAEGSALEGFWEALLPDDAKDVTPGEITELDLQCFGYGYNVASGKPLEKGNLLKGAILDMSNPELLASLKARNYTKTDMKSSVLFSSRELSSAFGSTFSGGIGGNIAAVSLNIDAMFNRSETVENAISERYELYNAVVEKKQVWTSFSAKKLRDYLSDEFLADIQFIDSEAEAIKFLETYGTHLFPGYTFGGRLDVSNYMVSNTDSLSVAEGLTLTAKMGAAIATCNAGASFGFEQQYQNKETNVNQKSLYKYRSIGGKSVAGLSLDNLFQYHEDIGNGHYEYDEWVNSIDRDRNLDILGVAYGLSAIPVWELFPSTEQASVARGYVLRAYAKMCGDKLQEYNKQYPYLDREFGDDEDQEADGAITEYMSSLGNIVWSPTSVDQENKIMHSITAGSTVYLQSEHIGVPAGELNYKVIGGTSNVNLIDGANGVFTVTGAVDNEFVLGLYNGNTELDFISFKIVKREFSGGAGTKDNPYLISTATELQNLLNQSKWWGANYYFLLVNDIDASSIRVQTPMSESNPFRATLDGGFHTIRNYTSTADSYPIPTNTDIGFGLIGFNMGTIKNLKLDGINITINNAEKQLYPNLYGGAIAGVNAGKIENCVVSNSTIDVRKTYVSNDNDEIAYFVMVGGIAGSNRGTIKTSGAYNVNVRSQLNSDLKDGINCYTATGGLVGLLKGGTIEECFVHFTEGANGTRLLSQIVGSEKNKPYARGMTGSLVGWADKGNTSSPKISNCVVDIPSKLYTILSHVKTKNNTSGKYAGTVIGFNQGFEGNANITGCNVLNSTRRENISPGSDIDLATVANGAGGCYMSDENDTTYKLSVAGNDSIILRDSIKYEDLSAVLDSDIWSADTNGNAIISATDITGLNVSIGKTHFAYGTSWTPIGTSVTLVNRGGGEIKPIAYTLNTGSFSSNIIGNYNVIITVGGKSKSTLVSVDKCEIVSIYVSDNTDPEKSPLYMDTVYSTEGRNFEIIALLTNGKKISLLTQNNLSYVNYPANTYTISDQPLKFGENKIEVTYGALKDSFIVEAIENKVESIKIEVAPEDTNYRVGTKFTTDGMVVTATYTDGTTKIINNKDLEIIGATIIEGESTVIVSYGEYKTETVDVVGFVPLTIKELPTKTVFEVGENINLSGLVLSYTTDGVNYTDIFPQNCIISETSLSVVGDNVITVKYAGQSVSLTLVGLPRKYTIKFLGFNGQLISEAKYEMGATVNVPTAPSVNTYTFVSWDKPITEVTGDTTYTAIYEKTKYVITFIGFDGSVIDEREYSHGDTVIPPTAPNVDGYTFISWDKVITIALGNKTYTAVYESNVATPEPPIPDAPEKVKGDFDKDGQITAKDAVLLLQYIHFKDVVIDNLSDINGDGKITSNDAIYISNYLSDPITYPIN